MVQGAISATWRDDGLLQTGGAWSIPGVLMGGSQDIYLQYQNQTGGVRWYKGVWWLQADALNRSDTRYSAGGHSHSSPRIVALDHEPERISLIYYWQAQSGFALRFEATEDQLQPESRQRFAVGVVWQGDMFP